MYKLVIKGKLRTFNTIEKIEKTLDVTVSDRQREWLDRTARFGDKLYATVNPYQAEMACEGDTVDILLAETQEKLDYLFYTLREEV